MTSLTQLTGTLAWIRYQKNDFIIGQFKNGGDEFVAKGNMPNVQIGKEYTMTGTMEHHEKYGEQLAVVSYIMAIPRSRDGLIRVLSSDKFKGIGKKAACVIADSLGNDALYRLRKDPSLANTIKGLSRKQKAALLAGLEEFEKFDAVKLRLYQLGLSLQAVEQLCERYGEEVFAKVRHDITAPYYSIRGFGLKQEKVLAAGLGVDERDERIQTVALYDKLRNGLVRTGCTCMSYDDLRSEAKDFDEEAFNRYLEILISQGRVTRIGADLYLSASVRIEETIASDMLRLREGNPKSVEARKVVEALNQTSIHYDPSQIKAIQNVFTSPVSILSGGPGTGKSTVCKGILQVFDAFFPHSRVAMCAPTGKAAKRLSEAVSDADGSTPYAPARTIHSLLGWDPTKGSFIKGRTDQLEADFIIVDEMSMVDESVFLALLKAIPDNCRLLLIGDSDQLESIAPGRVLADLMESGLFTTSVLTEVHRQQPKEGQPDSNGIVNLAEQIRLNKPCCFDKGVSFISAPKETLVKQLFELVVKNNLDCEHTQILAPRYQGECGIHEINRTLQHYYNPPLHIDGSDPSYRLKEYELHVGDKVMLLKNMPAENVFNGDIGWITKIETSKITVSFGTDHDVVFSKDISTYLTLAYAISIHKAQGSEFQTAVVAAPRSDWFMLSKKLLYTAISRAKKSLYILGDQDTFIQKVSSRHQPVRKTGLMLQLAQAEGEL